MISNKIQSGINGNIEIPGDKSISHRSIIIPSISSGISEINNILMSDDISMKSLKYSIKQNTLKAFSAGCNLVLHCNGNYKEMLTVAENSPIISKIITKKTSQLYKILS